MCPFVFVFGSNTQGRHGAGAARCAVQYYGAIYGQAEGRQGYSYAIVTKELRPGYTQPGMQEIRAGVERFVEYARAHPELCFYITAVGCGLAGFNPRDVAPMFHGVPENCLLPPRWEQYLGSDGSYHYHHDWV